jgi:hypothetical protein
MSGESTDNRAGEGDRLATAGELLRFFGRDAFYTAPEFRREKFFLKYGKVYPQTAAEMVTTYPTIPFAVIRAMVVE